MRRSRKSRSSLVAPWAVLPASLLLLMGLAACSKAEPPSEETPAATAVEAQTSEVQTSEAQTSEAQTSEETPSETPPAAEEITITGNLPPKWVNQGDKKVGPGDTILWKVVNGKHGLRFPAKADCDLALATMTFNPPLDPIAGGGCQSKTKDHSGDLIVSAKVNLVLARDLPFDCVVHKTAMPGVLKPK